MTKHNEPNFGMCDAFMDIFGFKRVKNYKEDPKVSAAEVVSHKREQKLPSVDKFTIVYKGQQIGKINASLVKKQHVTDDQLEIIKQLHVEKEHIFDHMRRTDNQRLLVLLSDIVTEIEFDLQRVWGFECNKNMHRFWNVPKCSCPKFDNEDRYGTPYTIVNLGCLVHGEI